MHKKKKNNPSIIIVVLILLLFILLPFRKKMAYFVSSLFVAPEKTIHLVGNGTNKFFSAFISISRLRAENNDLSAKIISLEVDRSKISELENENKILKKELGFSEKNSDYNLEAATIIGRDPTSSYDHIIIDKGSKDGVKTGTAVLSGGALVGQASEVSNDQSKVTLITSNDSVILAMLQNSRAKGALQGGISGLVLEDIDKDVNFEKDEYVVTSGLDGQLRAGILIGKATDIQSSSSDLFKNITVEPIADLSKLEIVFLLK